MTYDFTLCIIVAGLFTSYPCEGGTNNDTCYYAGNNCFSRQ